jgi:flavin-dependent dehydrogenase
MVGDAFGFVDPMLSPGVFTALQSAELVADALVPLLASPRTPSPAQVAEALRPYAVAQTSLLAAWQELVASLYDGRLVALMLAGQDWMGRGSGSLKRAVQNHIERHVALQASGMATTARYSRSLLRLLSRHALRGVGPGPLAIR